MDDSYGVSTRLSARNAIALERSSHHGESSRTLESLQPACVLDPLRRLQYQLAMGAQPHSVAICNAGWQGQRLGQQQMVPSGFRTDHGTQMVIDTVSSLGWPMEFGTSAAVGCGCTPTRKSG